MTADSKTFTPEDVSAHLLRLTANQSTARVVIQTHYGSHPLAVTELWRHGDTLHIGVLACGPDEP